MARPIAGPFCFAQPSHTGSSFSQTEQGDEEAFQRVAASSPFEETPHRWPMSRFCSRFVCEDPNEGCTTI
jgi:hypothetical protein